VFLCLFLGEKKSRNEFILLLGFAGQLVLDSAGADGSVQCVDRVSASLKTFENWIPTAQEEDSIRSGVSVRDGRV
jgi:hypothetical protein